MNVSWYFCGRYCGEREIADDSLVGSLARAMTGEDNMADIGAKAQALCDELNEIAPGCASVGFAAPAGAGGGGGRLECGEEMKS